jgi:hypothetical protein
MMNTVDATRETLPGRDKKMQRMAGTLFFNLLAASPPPLISR